MGFRRGVLSAILGILGAALGLHPSIVLSSRSTSYPIRKRGPKGQKKKKTWGGEKQKVRVKKGLCGGTKNPHPRQKALDAGRPWVPGPTGNKICRQNPTKRGVHSPAQKRTPWPSLGRGAGEIPFTHFGEITYSGFLDKVWPQNKRGKEKQNKSNTRKPLPPRVPRKGLRRSKENPKNARGPEWHPGKTPRNGTHGQNGRKRQKRRDTKRKKPEKQVRVRGCPVTT